MFSPNVQEDVRQTVAINQFKSIDEICDALNQEGRVQNILEKHTEVSEVDANRFVQSFAYENGLQVSTVQPYSWSFSIDDKKLFDDGLIELNINYIGKRFECSKVDLSKITQSTDDMPQDAHIFAHQAWLKKLDDQLTHWENELKSFGDSEKTELSVMLRALKSYYNTFKTSSMNVSKEAIIETERQWNSFQNKFNDFKNKFRKS